MAYYQTSCLQLDFSSQEGFPVSSAIASKTKSISPIIKSFNKTVFFLLHKWMKHSYGWFKEC